jgi:hypothetical protein
MDRITPPRGPARGVSPGRPVADGAKFERGDVGILGAMAGPCGPPALAQGPNPELKHYCSFCFTRLPPRCQRRPVATSPPRTMP